VEDLGSRDPARDQWPKLDPRQTTLLAPSLKCTTPVPSRLKPKDVQTVHVAGHRVIVEVALYDRPQPFPDFGHWLMPAPSKLLLKLFQLGCEALPDRLARDGESAGFPSLSADMRKTQKIKCVRFALTALLSIRGCMAPELDQARLIWMQFQPELVQTFLPFLEETLGVISVFESHDDIICVTDDDDVARGTMLSPVLYP
jgi:hypothetical protein